MSNKIETYLAYKRKVLEGMERELTLMLVEVISRNYEWSGIGYAELKEAALDMLEYDSKNPILLTFLKRGMNLLENGYGNRKNYNDLRNKISSCKEEITSIEEFMNRE